MQYLGFDIHKRYTFYPQMDSAGQIRRQGKLPNDRRSTQHEATGNTYAIVQVLKKHAGRIVVSNPLQTRAIAGAKIKTDKIDAESRYGSLLAAGCRKYGCPMRRPRHFANASPTA